MARRPRTSSYSGNRRRHQGQNRNRNRGNRGRNAQQIDPRRFVKNAKPVEITEYIAENDFIDFDINEILHKNLANRGYINPTQIQDKAIPVILQGHDVIGIANTGTGKTGAFMLPLLHKLMENPGQKALIIAPTRELALQIEQEGKAFAKDSGLFGATLIGGVPIGPQLKSLRNKPEVIIGTPGRIKDHVERGTLRLNEISTVVLDEVDRMLDMGFINDIRTILGGLPKERHSLFFSATMSRTIEDLIKTFTSSPRTIMARTSETSDNVDQSIIHYFEKSDKMDKLHDLLIGEKVAKVLIFSETKRSVERLSKELNIKGFKVDAMHGDKSQGQRQRALRKFKDDQIKILVATDVAARGIDVADISHVINFDTPQTYDDYTHRIGRTGRSGKTGYAVTFITH